MLLAHHFLCYPHFPKPTHSAGICVYYQSTRWSFLRDLLCVVPECLPHVGNREDGLHLSRNELWRRDACLITDSRQGGRTVEDDEIQVWSVSGGWLFVKKIGPFCDLISCLMVLLADWAIPCCKLLVIMFLGPLVILFKVAYVLGVRSCLSSISLCDVVMTSRVYHVFVLSWPQALGRWSAVKSSCLHSILYVM